MSPPTPALATLSGTVQQAEEKEAVPPMPSATTLAPPAEEAETPYLDSLPSTPRAGTQEDDEEETPYILSQLPQSAVPMEQDFTAAPPGAEHQAASAAEQSADVAQPPGSGGTN